MHVPGLKRGVYVCVKATELTVKHGDVWTKMHKLRINYF